MSKENGPSGTIPWAWMLVSALAGAAALLLSNTASSLRQNKRSKVVIYALALSGLIETASVTSCVFSNSPLYVHQSPCLDDWCLCSWESFQPAMSRSDFQESR